MIDVICLLSGSDLFLKSYSHKCIFLMTFTLLVSFIVCTAGFEMENGLCLDPNRPRRYNLQKRDTTITTDGAIINLQVRVHSLSHQSDVKFIMDIDFPRQYIFYLLKRIVKFQL